MYEDMESLEGNEANISGLLEQIQPYLNKKPERKVGTVTHCVGLGVGLFPKQSMPAGVMTPSSITSNGGGH